MMITRSTEFSSNPLKKDARAHAVPVNRRDDSKPFAIVGLAAVITGGLMAAAIAPAPTEPLVWMVAYLVLVVGVAQAALGVGQDRLAGEPLTRTWLWAEFALFNLGSTGVIAGRLLDLPPLVDVGGVFIVAALFGFLWGGRGARKSGTLRWLYRIMIVLLLVSVPIGLLLAQLRAS